MKILSFILFICHAAMGSQVSPTNAHYLEIDNSKLMEVLSDPSHLIDDQFSAPEGLKSLVGFWLKIYVKYSFYHTLLYDRENQENIYEVIDNRDLFQKGHSPVALEILIRKRVHHIFSKYQKTFQFLQKNPNASFAIGSPGSNIVRIWGKRSAKEWKMISKNLRTQPGQRDRIMQGLSSADRFFPAMETIFKKFKIPHQITRLPLVESSFNLNAKSKADAVGVWQFLEKSAKEFLIVDSKNKIDERLSPIKSTYAAAKMFRRNYKLLKDWGLAIIAYNHGAKNLIPIAHRYRQEKISKLLDSKSKSPLGYASRNFYAEFLAILHAEAHRETLYGMKKISQPDSISIVKMKKSASVFEIASLYNISIYDLKVFNPDIFDLKRKLPKGTRVVLPRKLGESMVLAPVLLNPETVSNRAPAGFSEIEFIEYIR